MRRILPPNEESILRTLSYSDIFSFPLTKEEIKKYFLRVEFSFWDQTSFKNLLKSKKISFKNNFYFLKGREKIVDLRLEKNKISISKIEIAKKYALILSKIPSIEFIGISGSLALNSAGWDDDIDFFIITKAKTLWITRFLSVILLKSLRVRREKRGKKHSNKICLNMFLDKNNLLIPKFMQNIYTAHEIMQIKPIFNRNNTYREFLKINNWTFQIMPYSQFFLSKEIYFSSKNNFFLILIFRFLEKPFKFLQIMYMRNITNEKILSNLLAFHPNDLTRKVIKEYNMKLNYEV